MTFLYNFIFGLVSFTLIMKIIFGILVLTHFYFSKIKKDDPVKNELDLKILYWKSRVEFIFQMCIAILLIIIFNPWKNNQKLISREMGILFFVFGLITLLTAEWSTYFIESKIYQYLIHKKKENKES